MNMQLHSRLRSLAVAVLLCCLAASAFGQGVAYSNVASVQQPGSLVRVVGNAPVVVCKYPGTGGTPCTNLATTYTDPTLATACSSTTQVVAPGGAWTCSSTADAAGNIGFYAAAGNYAYYWASGNTWYGPYTVTLGAGKAAYSDTGKIWTDTGTSIFDGPLMATNIIGQLADKGGQLYNALAYGAVADGVTDTTNALQVCINAAQAAGSVCFIPAAPSPYMITTLTNPGNGWELRGATSRPYGATHGTVLKEITGHTGPMFSSAQTNAPRGVRISGIYWDANQSAKQILDLGVLTASEIDHNWFANLPDCTDHTNTETCSSMIRGGDMIDNHIYHNAFSGHGYCLNIQVLYDPYGSSHYYGAWQQGSIDNNMTMACDLGSRIGGFPTITHNDIEPGALSAPGLAAIDISDATPGFGAPYTAIVSENYFEMTGYSYGTGNYAPAAKAIRCGTDCLGIVAHSNIIYGSHTTPGSVGIDLGGAQMGEVTGNKNVYWETDVDASNINNHSGGTIHIDSNSGDPIYTGWSPATATVTVSGGQLTAVTIGNGGGSGYARAPWAVFSGGNCTTQPTVTLTTTAINGSSFNNGYYVSGYTITNPGAGCDGTLTLAILGGINQYLVKLPSGVTTTSTASGPSYGTRAQNNGLLAVDSLGQTVVGRMGLKLQAVNWSGTTALCPSSACVLDLSQGNQFYIANGATAYTYSVMNAQQGQKFSVWIRDTVAAGTTLLNTAFNFCTGANYVGTTSAGLMDFEVGPSGVVSEVCHTSLLAGINGIIKGNGAGGFSAAAAGTDYAAALPANAVGWLHNNGSGPDGWSTPAGGGNVTGPGSSVNNNLAVFSGSSGTLLVDSGISLSEVGQHTLRFYCTGTVGTASAQAYALTPGSTSTGCTGTSISVASPTGITGTITACYVFAATGGSASGSGAISLVKTTYSGTPGSLTATTNATSVCTLGVGSGKTQCSNTGLSVAVNPSDGISATVTTGQASDTTANVELTCVY